MGEAAELVAEGALRRAAVAGAGGGEVRGDEGEADERDEREQADAEETAEADAGSFAHDPDDGAEDELDREGQWPPARMSAAVRRGRASSQARRPARAAATMAAMENWSRVAYSAAETEKPKGRTELPT